MDILEQQLTNRKELVHQALRLTPEEARKLEQRTMASLTASQTKGKRSFARQWALAGIAVAAALFLWIQPFSLQPDTDPGQHLTAPPEPSPFRATSPGHELPTEPKPAAVSWQTEEERLELYRVFELGMTYDEAKRLFPELGELGPQGGLEGLGEAGLHEATMPVVLGNEQAVLSLHFQNGFLYAARYQIESRDEQKVQQLKKNLEAFYAPAFGSPTAEKIESGDSLAWGPYFNLALTKNYDGRFFLVWGMQGGEPGLEELYREREFTVQEAVDLALANKREFPSNTGEAKVVPVKGIPETVATTTLRTKVKLLYRGDYLVRFERIWTVKDKNGQDQQRSSVWSYQVTEEGGAKLAESRDIDQSMMDYLNAFTSRKD
ncbi:hypothetical protein NDK47_05925 [Brevibacillus ruminantium]|uniref:Uncharacterized protein n=1 Tax=Brevibacillus ruminantium TaxID=2950604 RepID=A0ABY4WQD8_9BACL|nr:hypothetical protein [Brevibacillus ruminantium]USG66836.1 hypothetical protein NDK47_05925 [Brevibacillus ruminantium]